MREHPQVDHRRARARLDDPPEDEEAQPRASDEPDTAAATSSPSSRPRSARPSARSARPRAAARRARRPATASGSATRARSGARAAIESATGIEPSRKSSRHEKWSTITPESTIPKPPPMPQTAESRPIPTLHLLGRELVADDREAEREERAAGAGEDAERDQRPDVPGERGAEAAGEEEPEADEQHPLLAELVAEPAEDRRRHGGRDEEAGQHPGRPRRGRAELLLEGPERREDHRLLERERRPASVRIAERDVVVLPPVLGIARPGRAACT